MNRLETLVFLDLSSNQISDLRPFSELKRVIILDLADNKINDLSGLPSVFTLNISSNQISDIVLLEGLTSLIEVDFSNNFINLSEGTQNRAILDFLLVEDTVVFYDPQKMDPFQSEPTVGIPGWRTSTWYLNYEVNYWPWIFHEEHGWQYVSENSTEEVIFLWDLGLGEWLFFNENIYRWMFLFGDNSGWIFTFGDNTPNRRFFQRFDDGSLFSVPEGLPVE